MRIPGWLINLLTFPGLIVHTAALRFCCDVLHIPVYEVAYYRGTLIHGQIATLRQAALICMGPLLVNTVVCAVLLFPVGFSWLLDDARVATSIAFAVLGWAGLAIGMHAFPTTTDVAHFSRAYEHAKPSLGAQMAGGVLRLLLFVVEKLRFVWIDFWYAVLVGLAPAMLMRLVLR